MSNTKDHQEPDWTHISKCHDWKNHVPKWMQEQWNSFDDPTKWIFSEWAQEIADAEERD
jgi:hypothetical protein